MKLSGQRQGSVSGLRTVEGVDNLSKICPITVEFGDDVVPSSARVTIGVERVCLAVLSIDKQAKVLTEVPQRR